MKGSHANRPLPTIEMPQPYASSVNVNRLLEKIRDWEIWADTQEKDSAHFSLKQFCLSKITPSQTERLL